MTLVYDGDCGICQWSADWVVRQRPEVVAVPSQKFLKQNPSGWDNARFNQEVMFLDGSSEPQWGAEAILALFRVTGHRFLGWRGWMPLARPLYPVISSNRSSISRMLGLMAECKVDG